MTAMNPMPSEPSEVEWDARPAGAAGDAWALPYAGLEWSLAGKTPLAGHEFQCRCRLFALCSVAAPETPGGKTACVLSLSGELDLYATPSLHAAIDSAGRQYGFAGAVLDLSGAWFIDSAGVDVFLSHWRLRKARPYLPLLAACGASGQVARSLLLARVARFAPVTDTAEQAARALLAAVPGQARPEGSDAGN